MALSPFMSLLLPTVSSTVGPSYATEMNQAISANGGDIDSHDHSPGKGALIPVAGLSINATWPFGGYSLTQAKQLTFQPQALPPTGTLNTLAFDSNGNLNVFDNLGDPAILMTLSGTVNTTTATNGISGNGYGSPVLVTWVSGGHNYNLIQAASTYADVLTGPIQLFDSTLAAISASVNLLSPPGLGASYTLTLPGATPGATGLITVDSTGLVAFSGVLQAGSGQGFVVVNVSGQPSVFPTVAPGSTVFLTIDKTGTLGDALVADNLSLSQASTVHVKAQGVSLPMRAAANANVSASTGNHANAASIFVDIGVSATVVTSNSASARPVRVLLTADGVGAFSSVSNVGGEVGLQILRDNVSIAVFNLEQGGATGGQHVSPAVISFLDTGATANTSHTYTVQSKTNGNGSAFNAYNVIQVQEL